MGFITGAAAVAKGVPWKMVGIAGGLILSAILVFSLVNARERIDTLSEQLSDARGQVALLTKARELDNKIRSENIQAKAEAEAQAKVIEDEINKAAQANPDWANEPIPAAVTDSLRRASEAASGQASD